MTFFTETAFFTPRVKNAIHRDSIVSHRVVTLSVLVSTLCVMPLAASTHRVPVTLRSATPFEGLARGDNTPNLDIDAEEA